MRNINIKGILIDTDKTFHLHMSLSIRSNGENVDIYLRTKFNLIEMLVNTITILTWRKESYKSLSPWKCKELSIGTTTYFFLQPFSFHCTSSTTNMQTWRPTLRTHVDFESYCHQSFPPCSIAFKKHVLSISKNFK